MESIEMQMSMLAYSTLDIFTEKSQIVPDFRRPQQDKNDKNQAAKEQDSAYLGLLMQSFVDRYELDVYGYVSITNFKYVVFKIGTRHNPQIVIKKAGRDVGVSITEYMGLIFKQLQSYHTEMMLNPFFDFDSHGTFINTTGTVASRGGRLSSVVMSDEGDDMSDYSSSSCSSCNSSEQATAQAPAKAVSLSSKKMNESWL